MTRWPAWATEPVAPHPPDDRWQPRGRRVLAALVGPGHAGGRGDGHPGADGGRREGPHGWAEQRAGLVRHRRQHAGRSAWLGGAGGVAAGVLPSRTHRRDRTRPRRPALRDEPGAVVSAGQRFPHRQVPADSRHRYGGAAHRRRPARCRRGLSRPAHPHRPRLGSTVRDAATTLECSPAQIALAWTLHQPAVATTLIGATSTEQLHANLDAAALALPADVLHTLDSTSQQRVSSPHRLFPPAAS